MFWRKTQRPPSPSRLTSSIPEMERHLAAMGSTTSASAADKADSSPATHKGIPTRPHHGQDHGDTQAVPSSNKPIPNLPPTAEDDAKASTPPAIKDTALSMPKKVSDIRSRATSARPHFLVLVTCLSYLLLQSLGINFGLRLINAYTEPRLHQAEIKLQAAWSDVISERVVYRQLDTLLATAMGQQYQESYEHCLARGLFRADTVYLSIDYTPYPDVRDQTMEWVMDNCDRLHYTPQVATPNPSKFVMMVDSFRKSAEEALALFKHRVALLRSKIRGIEQPLATEQPVLQSSHNTTTRYAQPEKMPFGFSLDCEGRTPCRLTHPGPYLSTADRKTMREAAAKANRDIYRWSWPFKTILYINAHIVALLSLVRYCILVCYVLAVRLCYPLVLTRPEWAPNTSKTARAQELLSKIATNMTRDEKLALGLFINTALYKLLHYEFDFITSEFDCLLLPIGLGFCVFHIPQALVFLNPVPGPTETLRSFCRAIHELYLIARGASVPEPTPKEECSPSAASSPPKPASKIGARFISPLTSISEDLQQERKAMHEEQDRQRDDVDPEYGYATETDSEYDSDVQHASYVDLTGGATPMVVDDGEEWAVVED